MKAISLLITSVFLFSFGAGVLAQETELPDPGLTPDNPFYFLDTVAEEIVTFFTFGDLKKAERYANLAAERLAEVQAIAEKGKPKLIEKTLARYEKQLEKSMARAEKAQSKDKNTEKVMEVVTRVGQATSKHLEVLAEVGEKVPEEARSAIENAMKSSIKGHTKVVEILKAKNALGDVPESVSLPAQVPQEVKDRIQTRAQQELQIEEFLEEPAESFESIRNRCIEEGGPREMCEKIPLKGFKSFKALEDFCLGVGSPSEFCTVLEEKCKELGVTTANECFRLLTATATTTYKAAEPTFVPAPSLSEEEMKERRREEAIEIPLEELECEFNEMIFYYREGCSFCQKVKDDGTIERIEELGVKVNQVDVATGSIQHQFSGVPTFVIAKNIYIGYKTFEQIKDLLGCQ